MSQSVAEVIESLSRTELRFLRIDYPSERLQLCYDYLCRLLLSLGEAVGHQDPVV